MAQSLLRGRNGSHEPVRASYSRAELALDRYIHVTGLAAAPLGLAWLASVLPSGADLANATALVYGAGLLAMLSASAAYNLAPPGPAKALLRRLDHAAIFVMIAGTYTPVAMLALAPDLGLPLCAIIWGMATIGAALKLAGIGLDERGFVLLYLAMGWSFLGLLRSFIAALPSEILVLLLAGGVLYSLGALIHAHGRWRFHNAIWHAMVLAAAALHFAAVASLLAVA